MQWQCVKKDWKKHMSNTAQRNEQLRQHRFRRNWRLQDVADKLGTTITTVQRWERGNQQPSAYYRAKLCELFDVSPQELGFEEEEALPPTPDNVEEVEAPHNAATEEIALWTVPYRRNPYFTGRSDLLAQLDQQLAAPGTGQASNLRQIALTQAQAVTGLGGIGKTQIAVEYAYRALAEERYVHTIWITAANEEMILSGLTTLADQLPGLRPPAEADQHVIAAAVVGWLERCQQPRPLIFDNADDLALIQPYLPRRGNGNILLTTRASAVGSFAAALEVTTMGLAEGIQFLLRRAQRFTTASDEEIDEVGNLVVELALFPLALDQAGAYIEETGCSVRDYLDLYRRSQHALLARRGTQITGYPASVATTWSISFACIEQANPAAADLLRLCAFLSPDYIPEELLTEGAAYWPPVLQEEATNPLRFNRMVEDLLRFSLIKRQAENHLLSIHRLVQVVQQDRMSQPTQRDWAERVIRAVNEVFPADPRVDAESWPQCLRYLEQVQACDALIRQHRLQLPEAANLLGRAGVYLREQGSFALAERLLQRGLAIAEQQPDSQQLQLASLLTNLGHLYFRQGKYEQAGPLLQRGLRLREQSLEPEHPDIAASLTDLGSLYTEQGKYAEAELVSERAIRIWEQALGSHHPHIASPLTNLGMLYAEQGKYAQAEVLHQRTLRIWEQTLGPHHPWTATALCNLGDVYAEQGKYAEAEVLLQRALHIREQTLVPHHRATATTLCNLAIVHEKQGKYVEAEPLYERALHIWEHALGPHHHLIAHALTGLANLSRQQGEYERAEALYQRALLLRQQQLGPQHIDVAQTLQELARFRQMQQRPDEALSLYQQALAIREQVLGAEHPKTIETRERLSDVLQTLGMI